MTGSGGWRMAAGSSAAAWLVRLLGATTRIRHHGDGEVRAREAAGERFILAFWHRHLLLMPYAYRGRRIAVLISRHRDGELAARAMQRLGIESVRGSSTRGGAAGLRGLLKKARRGYDLGFVPDGPKGPAGVAKPGVAAAAVATGYPIVPVALAASRCRRVGSWDRMVVPLPFARVHFVYGTAMTVPDRDRIEAATAELGRRLDAAEAEAERLAAGADDTGER